MMNPLFDFNLMDKNRFKRFEAPEKPERDNITFLKPETVKQIEENFEKNNIEILNIDVFDYIKSHSDIITPLFIITEKIRQLFDLSINIHLETYDEPTEDFSCLKFYIILDKPENFDEMFDKVSELKSFCAKETLEKTGTIFSELKF